MTKTFKTATDFRTWAKVMGIGEAAWSGFQTTLKQGPMDRTISANGLTMCLRISKDTKGYHVNVAFLG